MHRIRGTQRSRGGIFPRLTLVLVAAAVAVADSGPTLRIQMRPNQSAELRWPTNSSGFQLQQATSLTPPIRWEPLTLQPSIDGDHFSASLPASGTQRYLRLAGSGPSPWTVIAESSPLPGESGVSVTRETILYFSRPLAADAALTLQTFYASYGGRKLLSRSEISSDRRKASLFLLEPMPGSTRITVVLDATGLRDELGNEVDADGDARPGGTNIFQFDTFSLAAVMNTAVSGQVFASDPMPDTQNPGQFVNRPLAGVTITVDGREQDLRTTTDAEGRFKLQPIPAGRFFVHVDGRTAAGSQWPNGDFYPVVGKAWEAMAGREDNLAGGTGEIFLPLIKADTLRPVSTTTNTPITFPASVLAQNPGLEGVEIIVPPNTLFSDNGIRGGKVGIAPVPPDRLPEPLPPGLNLPLVITVQTDGPSNFDQPVPVRFPNLPDPVTGRLLPPGAKSALWSFNHDLGRWEIVGSMTVTADGRFVESDPGVGIRQPGWHGTQPGAQGEGGPLDSPAGGGPNSPNDNDGDGIPNGEDGDIDGDGIPNGEDPDADGDGLPNGEDPDVDDDGLGNGEDDDTDGDGLPNASDDDVDGDGQSNGDDGDVDGDGLPNGTDSDVDGDGVSNTEDDDADGDGLPNYADNDADGDGIPNEQDSDSGLECPPSALGKTKEDCPNPCQNPQVQITSNPPALVCPNEPITFQATGTPNGGAFSWSGGTAGGPADKAEYVARFPTPGTHQVTVTYTCPEGGGTATKSINVQVGESSGIAWCARFPQSTSTADLNSPFRENVDSFVAAMRAGNAAVSISTTFRPAERQYLMYWAFRIASGISPANATAPPAGVGICWKHYTAAGAIDNNAARQAAQAMIGPAPGYNIAFAPADPADGSRHFDRLAIDMTITWTADLTITNANGTTNIINTLPRHGGRKDLKETGNTQLHAVGATYGVIKLVDDYPHWSSDGH